MFGKLMLQKDKNIKESPDMGRLIERRLSMWKHDLIEELIQEAENCDKKLPTGISTMNIEQAYAVFLVWVFKIKFVKQFVLLQIELKMEAFFNLTMIQV